MGINNGAAGGLVSGNRTLKLVGWCVSNRNRRLNELQDNVEYVQIVYLK